MKRALAAVASALLIAGAAVVAATSEDHPDAASSVCGITGVAFCDPLTAPVAGGRQGDLDPAVWQVGRVVGEVNNPSELQPFPNEPAPACKSGVSQSTADRDVLVCDQASGHAGQVLVVNGGQNYSSISLSPRQPFDFAGRTGVISADVDMVATGNLGYWTSLWVTDQPVPAAAMGNQSLGYLPRNGFGITFDGTCSTAGGDRAAVGSVTVYSNTAETTILNPGSTCVATARGSLNHVEVRVSQSNIAVWASDAGGGNFRQIFTTAVNLSLTRGFVHYQTAERAPVKYHVAPGYAMNYWSKMGFDGPILPVTQAAQVPDSLTSGGSRGTNIGYALTGSGLTLSIPNVPANPTSAVLSMAVQMQYYTSTAASVSYSLNGGPVHVAPADVAGQLKGGAGVGYAFPVALSELRSGANSLTLTATGLNGGWPFIVSNVELQTTSGTPPTTTATTVSATTATTEATTTDPSTTTATTIPAQTCTATPGVVECPDGYTGDIFVGGTQIWPTDTTTTTTVPAASTTTTPATTTTIPATTTTAPATTTVPAPTTTVASGPVSDACRITDAVFCETFDQPHNGGTRTGDLDPVLWGASRFGQENDGNGQHTRIAWPTMNACGHSGTVEPPGDIRICNGQLHEAVNDNHSVTGVDMYPKQPFDFTGRTGVATFDVSADSEGSHGAWPEFIITDKPVPVTHSDVSNGGGTSGNNDVVPTEALNEFGFALAGGGQDSDCVFRQDKTGVSLMWVVRNGRFFEIPFSATGCVSKVAPGGALDHFELRVSQNHAEVWGADPGVTTLRQLAVADNINLTLTKGLVWINDVHYNADKFPSPNGQRDHMFVWDNLGFDGPPTYRDIGFDVVDNTEHLAGGTTDVGYYVGSGQRTFTVNNTGTPQTPTGAQVVFNYTMGGLTVPDISINGNPFITTAWPFYDSIGQSSRTISVAVPLSQVHPGVNTITFRAADGFFSVANMSLILVAGAPVP